MSQVEVIEGREIYVEGRPATPLCEGCPDAGKIREVQVRRWNGEPAPKGVLVYP